MNIVDNFLNLVIVSTSVELAVQWSSQSSVEDGAVFCKIDVSLNNSTFTPSKSP